MHIIRRLYKQNIVAGIGIIVLTTFIGCVPIQAAGISAIDAGFEATANILDIFDVDSSCNQKEVDQYFELYKQVPSSIRELLELYNVRIYIEPYPAAEAENYAASAITWPTLVDTAYKKDAVTNIRRQGKIICYTDVPDDCFAPEQMIFAIGNMLDNIASYMTGRYTGSMYGLSDGESWQGIYNRNNAKKLKNMSQIDELSMLNWPLNSYNAFADAFRLYVCHPDELQKASQMVYDYMDETINNIDTYPHKVIAVQNKAEKIADLPTAEQNITSNNNNENINIEEVNIEPAIDAVPVKNSEISNTEDFVEGSDIKIEKIQDSHIDNEDQTPGILDKIQGVINTIHTIKVNPIIIRVLSAIAIILVFILGIHFGKKAGTNKIAISKKSKEKNRPEKLKKTHVKKEKIKTEKPKKIKPQKIKKGEFAEIASKLKHYDLQTLIDLSKQGVDHTGIYHITNGITKTSEWKASNNIIRDATYRILNGSESQEVNADRIKTYWKILLIPLENSKCSDLQTLKKYYQWYTGRKSQ